MQYQDLILYHINIKQIFFFFFWRRKTGWPDWVILGSISALPIVELRGGIPVGVWLGLSPLTTFGLAVVGNMIPVPLLLLLVGKALKIPFLAKLLSSVQKKADAFKADGQAARALVKAYCEDEVLLGILSIISG